jgi:hypothetical protein
MRREMPAAIATAHTLRKSEQTLWTGSASHMSWFFGPLALLIGLLALVDTLTKALVFFGLGTVIRP